MAAAEYQVWLYDVWGNRVSTISADQIAKLSYALKLNAVGALTLTLPRDLVADRYVVQDARFEVWRRPEGGAWQRDGDAVWLLQTETRGLSRDLGRYRRLVAVTANHLLARRVVSYASGTSQSLKTDSADDLIKQYARENLGASAGSAGAYSRDWSTTLTIQADLGLGPSLTKEAARRNLLTVCQELARDAANEGTLVYFDVVWNGATLELRTYTGARGVDRSTLGSLGYLVVSAERGSLSGTVEATTDWGDAATYVTAGGPGQGAARIYGSAVAAAAEIGASPWGLREGWIEATQTTTTGALDAEAQAELRRRRPKKTLTGSLVSVPGAVYGVHWGWGDKVAAEFEDDRFTATVDAVTVTVERGGQETINAALRGESES